MNNKLLDNPISGLANCHVKGLYSIILQDRKDRDNGMKRIFYAGPEHEIGPFSWATKYFPVAPHNHRQDIALTGLFGIVSNWDFSVSRFGEPIYRYNFYSGILGELQVENAGETKLGVETHKYLDKKPLYLHADDIHTIEVFSPTAAWLVEEGTLRHEVTSAFAVNNWAPSAEGLYIPLDEIQLGDICDEIEEQLG